MANRDPENFVSFDDYMGLNEQAGKDAMARLLAQNAGTEADPEKIRAAANQHNQMALEAGYNPDRPDGGLYDSTGKSATNGLASYGDFVKGMEDPAQRQAAMEKLFGGRASAMDSMLAGTAGAGQLGEAKSQVGELNKYMEQQMSDAGDRYTQGGNARIINDKNTATALAAKQAAQDKLQKDKAAAGESAVKAWAKWKYATSGGPGGTGGAGVSRTDNDKAIERGWGDQTTGQGADYWRAEYNKEKANRGGKNYNVMTGAWA